MIRHRPGRRRKEQLLFRNKMSDSEDELERYVFEVAWEVANKGKIVVFVAFRSWHFDMKLKDISCCAASGLALVNLIRT